MYVCMCVCMCVCVYVCVYIYIHIYIYIYTCMYHSCIPGILSLWSKIYMRACARSVEQIGLVNGYQIL